MTARLLVALVLLLSVSTSRAALSDASATGFKVHHEFTVTGKTGAEVWTALVDIGHWWNKDHTYSGDASRLKLDPVAGGCWCEAFGEASVQHLEVINVIPRGLLRLRGALGPLQALPVDGVMTWSFKKADGGAITVLLDYVVGGSAGGLADLAGPVDQVLGEQAGRLERFLKTGSAEPKP